MLISFHSLALVIMNKFSIVYGIDVSKDQLDIACQQGSKISLQKIANTKSAILSWLHQQPLSSSTLCVLEPTGSYSHKLLYYLSQTSTQISLVNPNQSHGFTQALGLISKNDHQAALSLAQMGQVLDLPFYQAPCSAMQKRKQLLSTINALSKQKRALSNQIHAMEQQIIFAPLALDALKQTLETVQEQLQSLEEELNELSDQEHQQQLELLCSVVGIGPKTAHLLLSATGGLQHFQHARQLSKFVGLVPWSHQSGSSVRFAGGITKKGCRALRACLYMGARSARKHNLACKELYERLRALGKPHKKAMVAVANKLVKQAFGVVNSGVAFDNQYYLKFIVN